jgi:hypothetical protein
MFLEMTTPDMVGYLVSFAGIGILAGTLVMSVWGSPERRIQGVIGRKRDRHTLIMN